MRINFKICSYCNNSRPIFKNTKDGPQCLNCWKRNNANKPKKEKLKRMVVSSIEDRQKLITRIDKDFSLLIRLMYSTPGENVSHYRVKCYTCGVENTLMKMQCGHFISRKHSATRWMVDNCRPQCHFCNVDLYGNLTIFAEKLEKESPGLVAKLYNLQHEVFSYTIYELKELKEKIRNDIRILGFKRKI